MKIVYYYYYIIIIFIAWRVTLFSCHASVLGDVYYNSIQREEHYSKLLHSTETGLSKAVWASLNLLLVLFFDRRLRIVIIIIIGPFVIFAANVQWNTWKSSGSWQKPSPPGILKTGQTRNYGWEISQMVLVILRPRNIYTMFFPLTGRVTVFLL